MIHTSWRNESSNVSLVVLDKLIFVKKKLIIDGSVKVESLLITDNMSSKVVSFFKKSSRLKRLHIDGTDFITNCKGWNKIQREEQQGSVKYIKCKCRYKYTWQSCSSSTLGKNTIIFLLQGAGASSATHWSILFFYQKMLIKDDLVGI